MSRVKRGKTSHRKHKKILKAAKGYRGARSRLFKQAKEAVQHARQYSYRDRRRRKRDFRALWIIRINAAAKTNGLSYSRLINGLKRVGVGINRKMLSDLALRDSAAFAKLAEIAKKQIAD